VRQQAFAVALLRNRGRRLEQLFQRAMRGDQVSRAFLTDAGHAFDVVDGVTHQRQHIDDLVGPHAEFLNHPGDVVPRSLVSRIEHADGVADELEEILVPCDDGHLESCPIRLPPHWRRP
jgi:hypothetical protein